jgi:uncharacterized phage infection (PIP) family protein YhgE
MDLYKVTQLALLTLRITFGDRNLLVITIAAPLLLTLVIGAAFSQFITGGPAEIPVSTIPIAVVNQDQGTAIQTTVAGVTVPVATLNLGGQVTQLLTNPTDPTLAKLLKATPLTDSEARKAVNDGKLAAALILPPDLNQNNMGIINLENW